MILKPAYIVLSDHETYSPVEGSYVLWVSREAEPFLGDADAEKSGHLWGIIADAVDDGRLPGKVSDYIREIPLASLFAALERAGMLAELTPEVPEKEYS